MVGVLGHRQVGKTTLLGRVASAYHVLDTKQEHAEASHDPGLYIKKRAGKLVALDECQLVPELFPALKEWVRTHRRPGQFLMSGSVRFTSRDAIQESLTGRIMNLELLPFSVSELEGLPLPDVCPKAIAEVDLSSFMKRSLAKKVPKKQLQVIESYLIKGGLPGVCFIREGKLREQKIQEQLLTILDRDVRLVRKILVPYGEIRGLLEALARTAGEPIDITVLRKATGLSVPTIKKLIYAFEAVFLIRPVPIEGSTMGYSVWFEDTAERAWVAQETAESLRALGFFLFCNIRQQFEYRLGSAARYFSYRTRGGAHVPFCIRQKEGVLGILPIDSPDSFSQVSGTVESFLGAYGNAKLLLVHSENAPPRLLKPRAAVVSIASLVF